MISTQTANHSDTSPQPAGANSSMNALMGNNVTKLRFDSRIDLNRETRQRLSEQLNLALAASLDLYHQTKQAHWNVRGHHFQSRHELFDAVAERMLHYTDELAERVGSMGGYAEGAMKSAAKNSFLPDFKVEATSGQEHIRALVERYAIFCARLREMSSLSAELNDPVTEDLLIETLRVAEKDMWFLESHINA